MTVWAGATVLITGGTGSFGQSFTRLLLGEPGIRTIRIFSRDGHKQEEMARSFDDSCLRFFLGDVKDSDRLRRAFDGVDIVIHAAALKQIVAAEYNPLEAVQVNVVGTANVIEAALDRSVSRVMALSTDKACSPVNLYGATKAVLEKLIVQANAYSGPRQTRFSCVRYGNVIGSRGSVVPLFQEQRRSGVLTITHPEMTRFWIPLEQACLWIKARIEEMAGGELYVPRIPSVRIVDVATAIAPESEQRVVGLRPGEKIHETLVTADESLRAYPYPTHYTLAPQAPSWQLNFTHWTHPEEQAPFSYSSNQAGNFLSVEQIRAALPGALAEVS